MDLNSRPNHIGQSPLSGTLRAFSKSARGVYRVGSIYIRDRDSTFNTHFYRLRETKFEKTRKRANRIPALACN